MRKAKDILFFVFVFGVAVSSWLCRLPGAILGFLIANIQISFKAGYDYVVSGDFTTFLSKLETQVTQIQQNWRNK